MHRNIVGYHSDDAGEWVAELACGHQQHVRHRPPFFVREWVLDAQGRTSHLGQPIECPLCDRAELPSGAQFERTSPRWDARSVPNGLLHSHRIASGTWARIVVHEGMLRYFDHTTSTTGLEIHSGSEKIVPPEVEHRVELLNDSSFSIEFLSISRHAPETQTGSSFDPSGGEAACMAHLVCESCGILIDGSEHRAGCTFVSPT